MNVTSFSAKHLFRNKESLTRVKYYRFRIEQACYISFGPAMYLHTEIKPYLCSIQMEQNII